MKKAHILCCLGLIVLLMLTACGIARRGQFLLFVDYEKLNGAQVGDTVDVKEEDILLDGTYIKTAEAEIQKDPVTGAENAVVIVYFSDAGAVKLGEITSEYLGRTLAIVSEGKLISAPRIQSEIWDGKVMITLPSGDLSEADNLARKLRGR